MSASLVGSEMCIRDSHQTQQEGPAPAGEPAGAGPSAAPPADRQVQSVPVSYTHLTLPTICSV
eukprot:7970827-Alexandrium_andersonii.AAC.1